MKPLLQTAETHRFALSIAVAIALGITVHPVFLVVAQIMAIAVCAHLMSGVLHQRRSAATQGQQHP